MLKYFLRSFLLTFSVLLLLGGPAVFGYTPPADKEVLPTVTPAAAPKVIEIVPAAVEVLPPAAIEALQPAAPAYTEEELELLALVIYQEAGADACSNACRQMVGEVVLNRVADPRFPATMREVVLAKRQYGRLYWTGPVWPSRASKANEAHAVARAYDTARALLDGSAARILPPDTVWQAEFRQGTQVVAYDGGMYFCR